MPTPQAKTKQKLLEQRGHRCEQCGLETWLDRPIALELHHIDGNISNNAEQNLMLLCPNCHLLTDTHSRRANKRQQISQKVSNEKLLRAMDTCDTIHQVLLTVGLDSRGGENFGRVYRLAIDYGYKKFL